MCARRTSTLSPDTHAARPDFTPRSLKPRHYEGWVWAARFYRDPSSPAPFHLPVAVTEGSLTEKVNENGVRLWTDRSRPRQ